MALISELWERIPDNIQWGLIWGAGFAAFFSLIAIAIWLLMVLTTGDLDPWGDIQFVDVQGVEPGISIWTILIAYWGGGLAAGTLAGWMRTLAKSAWWGAVLTGIVAGMPVSAAMMLVIFGFAGWSRLATMSWIAGFLVFGPFYALLIKYRYSGHLYQDEDGGWKIDPD